MTLHDLTSGFLWSCSNRRMAAMHFPTKFGVNINKTWQWRFSEFQFCSSRNLGFKLIWHVQHKDSVVLWLYTICSAAGPTDADSIVSKPPLATMYANRRQNHLMSTLQLHVSRFCELPPIEWHTANNTLSIRHTRTIKQTNIACITTQTQCVPSPRSACPFQLTALQAAANKQIKYRNNKHGGF